MSKDFMNVNDVNNFFKEIYYDLLSPFKWGDNKLEWKINNWYKKPPSEVYHKNKDILILEYK